MGSILASRAALVLGVLVDVGRWRSDVVVKLATRDLPAQGGLHPADVGGLLAGGLLGVALALATYRLGALCAVWLQRSPWRSHKVPAKPG
jgi:hypothetical protein